MIPGFEQVVPANASNPQDPLAVFWEAPWEAPCEKPVVDE
jgi:hypothetical protein